MPRYSTAELSEMVLLYGASGRSSRETARRYAAQHPEGPHPTHTTIEGVVRRFLQSGNVAPARRAASQRRQVDDADILAYFQLNPHTSIRDVSRQSGLGIGTIWRILTKQHYHPYHLQPVHAMHPNDYQLRLDFSNTMLMQVDERAAFLQNVLWTDESQFTRDGIVNRHNQHYWAGTNPHWTRATHHQERWSTNVWCGIWRNTVIGPIFYGGTLNGGRYVELLRLHVCEWADELPLATLRDTWFQHDGAPPHKLREVTQLLTNTFGERWMGQYGPTRWPPRSPDLTPLDFFLWGYLKNEVYATPPRDIDDLKGRVEAACRRLTPDVLRAVLVNMEQRLRTCIVVEGGHFEHIL